MKQKAGNDKDNESQSWLLEIGALISLHCPRGWCQGTLVALAVHPWVTVLPYRLPWSAGQRPWV